MTDISIVIPFYNEAPYLAQAVNSVALQRLASAEILVVNDNPERFTAEEVRALCGNVPVRVVQHTRNMGLSAARNTGFDLAQGAHVCFLDADDLYLDGGLARQLAFAQETRADLTHAICAIQPLNRGQARYPTREEILFGSKALKGGLRAFPEAQFLPFTSGFLFSRDFLARTGLRFDASQPRVEDRLCILLAVTAAQSIAILGSAARVYRRRPNSLTLLPEDTEKRRLALSLLEKCLGLIRSEVDAGRLPEVHFRRELFHTVARLLTGYDIVAEIARNPDTPVSQDMAQRLRAMLGEKSFGPPIFEDPVLSQIDYRRVNGKVVPIDAKRFQSFHRALRDGDFAAAAEIASPAPRPLSSPSVHKARGARLVLHIGTHKTGTTFIQGNLRQCRTLLRAKGILYPETGDTLDTNDIGGPARPGGSPGHQGLLNAALAGDADVKAAFHDEIAKSGADTVVVSCENIFAPLLEPAERRAAQIERFFSGFSDRRLVAGIRRPDIWLDRHYRELACNGRFNILGGIDIFAHEYADKIFDLAQRFGLFEERFSTRVHLVGFDKAVAAKRLWAAHLEAFGLPPDLPEQPETFRNPIPSRAETALAELAFHLVRDPVERMALLHAFFRLPAPDEAADTAPLQSPAQRSALIERARGLSAAFLAERGLDANWDAWRAEVEAENWSPAPSVSLAMMSRLAEAAQASGMGLLAPRGGDDEQGARPAGALPDPSRGMVGPATP